MAHALAADSSSYSYFNHFIKLQNDKVVKTSRGLEEFIEFLTVVQ